VRACVRACTDVGVGVHRDDDLGRKEAEAVCISFKVALKGVNGWQ